MEQKRFEQFLELVGKKKNKPEEETKIVSGAELREAVAKILLSSIKEREERRG